MVVAARQSITNDWWEKHRHRFELFISELVDEEISRGDEEAAARRIRKASGIERLFISPEVENLAQSLLDKGTVPAGSEEDALHIAVASAHGVDFLLTWNFKHINNAEKKAEIEAVVESCGYTCPQLCSPEELGGNSND